MAPKSCACWHPTVSSCNGYVNATCRVSKASCGRCGPKIANITLVLDEVVSPAVQVTALPMHEADSRTLSEAPSNPADAAPRRNSDPLYEKTRLNPDFTFDTLVTGRSNDLARAAAQQVGTQSGHVLQPACSSMAALGLGKTHLVHALGNEVWRHNPDQVIRYVHAHDYIADVVRAYQQKAFDTFKRYYCSLDLLIIDDIQFLNGKDRTQEEFFFAFNALIEAKKQIVITCDTYPKDIQGLENRLISRFDWGLTVQIEPPELEMRVAILKKKAEATEVPLGDDVAFLIAKNLRSNVRELEGALNRVIAFARFHGRDITIEVRQGSPEGRHRRPQSPDHAGTDPEVRRRLLQDQGRRHVLAEAYARHRPPAPDRHVAGPRTDPAQPAGNRRCLRRPRPHHRPARLPHHYRPARQGWPTQ